ncbi:hypothetical protein CYY_006020 [Polysphondylium violaceum]|uniref:Uncharacterized protein n=1 Tax=Polysphondylium violaceum TaxID=133409 RepID=A0A8J4UYF1_9MYCE|nr:hypothetical protein CYY_006020 [Polysphondylium violaceum]
MASLFHSNSNFVTKQTESFCIKCQKRNPLLSSFISVQDKTGIQSVSRQFFKLLLNHPTVSIDMIIGNINSTRNCATTQRFYDYASVLYGLGYIDKFRDQN